MKIEGKRSERRKLRVCPD